MSELEYLMFQIYSDIKYTKDLSFEDFMENEACEYYERAD